MKAKNIISWISIVLALACAVGIVYIPAFQPVFLGVLLLNLLLPIVFHKGYGKPALTVCRLFVGSVAYHFQDILKVCLENKDLHLGEIIQTPADGLVKYHCK